MRLGLALRAFFAILFGKPLPPELEPAPKALPAAVREAQAAMAEVAQRPVTPPPPTIDEAAIRAEAAEAGAVAALAILQGSGRLLDFVGEDIEGYGDADVGAAVRDIHKGLRRALADHFPVKPLRSEPEEAVVTIAAGFDPHEVRLVGNVVGEPPFRGTLKHKGWRVEKVALPKLATGAARFVACPAEVEL